jgi:hypothetical protein
VINLELQAGFLTYGALPALFVKESRDTIGI